MKPTQKSISEFDKFFFIMTNKLNYDINSYKEILFFQIIAFTNEMVLPDTEFMLEMAEKGLLKVIELFAKELMENIKAERDISKQINDILNPDL